MANDDFNYIFQQLNSGQNPTPPVNDNCYVMPEYNAFSGTQENNFGFRSVNESGEDFIFTPNK